MTYKRCWTLLRARLEDMREFHRGEYKKIYRTREQCMLVTADRDWARMTAYEHALALMNLLEREVGTTVGRG